MSSEPTTVRSDLSELIAENFGANATYVETLLARFRSDPSLVDESWRAYFEELLGNGQVASAGAVTSSVQPEPAQLQAQSAQPGGDGKQAAVTQKAAASPAPAPATASQP